MWQGAQAGWRTCVGGLLASVVADGGHDVRRHPHLRMHDHIGLLLMVNSACKLDRASLELFKFDVLPLSF